MINDSIKNIRKYSNISENICKFIENLSTDIECGRHQLDGENYVNVELYETKPPESGVFESHKKYIDIQIILKGTERIDFVDTDKLSVDTPYSPEKDIVFYKSENVIAGKVILEESQFAVFYPGEAHMPQLNSGSLPVSVKKAVVKIKV